MSFLLIATNRWVQLAAGTALALVFGFGLGHHQKTLEDASRALSEARRAIQTQKAQASVTASIDQHTIQATAKTQATTNANLQKIPLYVTRTADERCIVSTGAIRLLDAAALDTVPATPSGVQFPDPGLGSPDTDSGVKLSDLVSADIVNAGNYHQLAERLRAWDDWYTEQARVVAGK